MHEHFHKITGLVQKNVKLQSQSTGYTVYFQIVYRLL